MTEQEKKDFIKRCKKMELLCDVYLLFNLYIPIIAFGVIIFIGIMKTTGILR